MSPRCKATSARLPRHPAVAYLFLVDVFNSRMKSNEPERGDFVCSEAIRREKPRSCWSDFTKRESPFALNPEGLLPSLGRRLSSISVWTQRELAKSLRFTTIFLGMDRRIITHLSFVSIATSNHTMKPTAPDRVIASNLAIDPARGLSLSC